MDDRNPLSQNFTIKSLLKFAFPTILMMIFMGLYTVADTIFVARFVATNALSALNIVCPVINLIVGLGTMLATGGSAVIARKMGAGKPTRAAQDFTLIIAAGVLAGVVLAVLGMVFIDRIVWGLGAGSILFPYCKDYLFILLFFTPASILQVLFQNLMVTAGRPGIGMVLGISAGIANILLDYIFMVVLHMGIKGAAFILGSPLVGIFAERGTPVYEIARNGFLIFHFSFLFCELNIFTSAAFTALSNGKLSAILSFLRTFGLITVLLLTLPKVLGVMGVWLAVPTAELITMITALVFLHQNREKYHYA